MTPGTSEQIRHRAGTSDGIPEQGRLVVDIGDTTIGIFRVGGKLFAYENSCPHMGGPVCQGLIIPAVRELINDKQVSTGYAFDESEMRIVCPWRLVGQPGPTSRWQNKHSSPDVKFGTGFPT